MRICIFAEGSYPYVLGGVSSWINTLIKSFPEHEFIVYSISADSSNEGIYKYKIYDNVVKIVDVFLDKIQFIEENKGKKYKFDMGKDKALSGLLMSNSFSWDLVFEFFNSAKFKYATEFFMSRNFFNHVKHMYATQFPYTPFTEFLWTMRSIYLVLFSLLLKDLPEADIYHSVSTGYAGILGSYAKYLYKKPFILSEHGIYTREREEEIIKADWVKGYYKEIWIKYFYNLSRGAYSFADIVTTLFKTNMELQIELGCPEEKIRIIPNGVEVSRFENLPLKEDDEFINIGAIVRVVPIKDIKTMLQSFVIVKNKIKNARFIIMGPKDEAPDYYKECTDLVNQMNLQDVDFTGTVQISDYIGKMDVLVLTSISEGQPLAVMEGMAAKKPHVCTNVGDCRDLIFGRQDHFGQAGFIEYVMDYNGIAESIIKLCRDKGLREEMGRNAYNRVSKLYKKEYMIESFKKIYKQFGSD